MPRELIQRQTALSGNIVQFCRYLRSKGFTISYQEQTEAIQAISFIPIGDRRLFKLALKAILAKNHWQRQQFNDLYEEFWKQLEKATDSKVKDLEEDKPAQQDKKAQAPPSLNALKDWLYRDDTNETEEIAAFSDTEVFTKKDFSNMSDDELRLLSTYLRKLARQLAHIKSRLKQPSKRTNQLDLKRTFRSNLRRGADIQQLIYSEPKDRKLKIVLLCDVSKSMDLYSRFFMLMIYAFQSAYDRIETFVFSTAIHRISELLDNHEFDEAYEIISDRVPQWSGGTRIGNCLSTFYEDFGVRMLNKKTVVFIVSDGWDRGESDTLRQAMHNIYKNSKKVIWLNPLAGKDDFSPEVTGLKVAMPYIDVFQSAHNLESLKEAVKHLRHGRRKVSW